MISGWRAFVCRRRECGDYDRKVRSKRSDERLVGIEDAGYEDRLVSAHIMGSMHISSTMLFDGVSCV